MPYPLPRAIRSAHKRAGGRLPPVLPGKFTQPLPCALEAEAAAELPGDVVAPVRVDLDEVQQLLPGDELP